MHVATVNLQVEDDKRSEALSAIDGYSSDAPWPGCLTCRLMADAADSQLLTLVSEWDSREAPDGFISSREFLILRACAWSFATIRKSFWTRSPSIEDVTWREVTIAGPRYWSTSFDTYEARTPVRAGPILLGRALPKRARSRRLLSYVQNNGPRR